MEEEADVDVVAGVPGRAESLRRPPQLRASRRPAVNRSSRRFKCCLSRD